MFSEKLIQGLGLVKAAMTERWPPKAEKTAAGRPNFKKIILLHINYIWVKIGRHTENQLPGTPQSE